MDNKTIDHIDVDQLVKGILDGTVSFPINIMRFAVSDGSDTFSEETFEHNVYKSDKKNKKTKKQLVKLTQTVYEIAKKELQITDYKKTPNKAPVLRIKTGATSAVLTDRSCGDTPFCYVMTRLINNNELLSGLLKNGDIVANHSDQYRNEGMAVWNGKKAYLEFDENIDEYGYVPAEFKTIDEFPINYWSETIDHNRLIPVHGIVFEELQENIICAEPFVSYFTKNNNVYYVVHDEQIASRCGVEEIENYLSSDVAFFSHHEPKDKYERQSIEKISEMIKKTNPQLPDMTADNVLLL
jgi:hypothetical protein